MDIISNILRIRNKIGNAFLPDKDECGDRNTCGNGTCSNTDGGFECACSTGFEPNMMGRCSGK